MSGIIALSVNPAVYGGKDIDREFTTDVKWTAFYHQQLGQEFSGLASIHKKFRDKIQLRTHRGLFRAKFDDDELRDFSAPLAIGHISAGLREPMLISRSCFPTFAVCFAGNLKNREELLAELTNKGFYFEHCDDLAIITALMTLSNYDQSQNIDQNFIRAITAMSHKICGAYAMAILTLEKIYVVRGPDGHQPLVLAQKRGAVAVVSESCSLYNQGFQYVRDLVAGEIVTLENGMADTIGQIKIDSLQPQVCAFKWIYTSFPATKINQLTAGQVRKRLGARLAQRDIADGFFPDIVAPVPDSGRYHALGYHQEFVRQAKESKIPVEKIPYYDEVLAKFTYAGRSYTPADPESRKIEAEKKQIPVEEAEYAGKIIVICDDSIVRGTQTVNDLVPKLQVNGFKEIHLRISAPKLVNVCDFDKANKKMDDLAAINFTSKTIRSDLEMAKRLTVASCRFSTTEDVAAAIGQPLSQLCVSCHINQF